MIGKQTDSQKTAHEEKKEAQPLYNTMLDEEEKRTHAFWIT